MQKMRCVRVERVGAFAVTESAVRAPGEGEVQVEVEITGLCRTDLKLIRKGHRDLRLPRIPGEEVVGIVRALGAQAGDVRVGERVYVYPGQWCGHCPMCRRGAENLCANMQIMGFHRDGGFAQFVTVPAASVIRVPTGLDPEQAVFAEPLSCCLNALELAGLCPGMTVAIWGAGPAGTLLHRAAAAMGAEPLCIEPDRRRREIVGGSPDAAGRRFDVCVAAVGARSAYEAALDCLGPRGRLVVFSGLLPAEDAVVLSFNQLHYFEQSLVGAYGCCYRHGEAALAHIAAGRIAVADMISHRLPLHDLDQALRLVEERRGMKILLYP